MTGRPSDFTPEMANTICEELAKGTSLRSICEVEGLPSARTVHRWLASEEEWSVAFRQQYAHAREEQAEVYAERVVDDALIATDAALGRLKMDALKWAAGKLAPKKYGDKVVVGGDPDGAPIQITQIVRRIVGPGNPDTPSLPAPAPTREV